MRIRIVTDNEIYMLQRRRFLFWGKMLPDIFTYMHNHYVCFNPGRRFKTKSHDEAHEEACKYLRQYGSRKNLYKTEVRL